MSNLKQKVTNTSNLNDNEIRIANNEVALLGLLLTDPTQEAYLSISEQIRPEMFHFKSNQILYSAISSVINSSINFDLTNLWNYLDKNKLTDDISAFGMRAVEYIPYLTKNPGFISELKKYTENIIKQYKTDRLYDLLISSKDTIENKKFDISDLISKLQVNLLNIDISEIHSSYDKVYDTAQSILNRILKHDNNDEIGVGLSLGFPELDDLLLGINKGDLIIIGARPAMGKTAFALNIVNNIARNNKTVLFFSLEMSNAQLVQRMMATESFVPIRQLKSKNINIEEQRALMQTVELMRSWKVFLNERSTSTISDIITSCKRFANNNQVDLIVIDYLQLISGSSSNKQQESRQLEIATISRSLKQLARDINCPIIALSQLSRNLEKREDKTPIMSDLRESGGIEQDADRVIFLHRPEVYKNRQNINNESKTENGQKSEIKQEASVANIIVGKNRHGATGVVQLVFYPEINRFVYEHRPQDFRSSITNTPKQKED
ncbi:replicative DNA helicase [Mycoplasma enhydrae]|uniref:replicative DNA helicase n=1 Tax=Mycoplasma enhydrae TaxID=2499220 RepID=UPI0021E8C31E|nr:replicative DNA helicase [Mycoplasma enhydrae]MCV3733879.1 replicative DNA helicase [Mycoplasma enhydrae]MCV3753654.1 replicative DNA helicase [Mycoplasma enhydrae]